MTGPLHFPFRVIDANGREVTIGINAQDGHVVFSNLPSWFKVGPDVADLLAPSVQAASEAARRQQQKRRRS